MQNQTQLQSENQLLKSNLKQLAKSLYNAESLIRYYEDLLILKEKANKENNYSISNNFYNPEIVSVLQNKKERVYYTDLNLNKNKWYRFQIFK